MKREAFGIRSHISAVVFLPFCSIAQHVVTLRKSQNELSEP